MAKTNDTRIGWSTRIGPQHAEDFYLVLHGLDATPERVAGLCETIRRDSPSAHIVVPQLPFEWWRAADLHSVGNAVLDFLANEVDLRGYQSIRIVGHSAGGVLAQGVFLAARTERTTHSLNAFTGDRLRLILVAPTNHGWEVTHHQPLAEKVIWTLGTWVIPIFSLWYQLFAFLTHKQYEPLVAQQLRTGSPYLVWMRLTWLDLQRREDWAGQRPEVIELLGSIDEVVSWRAMVDTVIGGEFRSSC